LAEIMRNQICTQFEVEFETAMAHAALLFGGSIAIGNNTNLTFYPFAGIGGGVVFWSTSVTAL
jgi:hypothetical protein